MSQSVPPRLAPTILRVARVCFLRRIVANICCNSSDNSSMCVTGVNVGSMQCCGKRFAEPET
jgi:hypothetical protein